MVAVFFVITGAFALALMAGSMMVAVALLMSGIVVAFVMAVAWMRPNAETTEHHPKIDRLFDDTAP